MSASRMPTRLPSWEKAMPRFAVSDDLPTPPFPDATAITRQSLGSRAAQPRREGLPFLGSHDAEGEREAAHVGDIREGSLDLFLERVTKRAACDRQHDRQRDDAVCDLDVAHHVELGHGAPQ